MSERKTVWGTRTTHHNWGCGEHATVEPEAAFRQYISFIIPSATLLLPCCAVYANKRRARMVVWITHKDSTRLCVGGYLQMMKTG